MGTAARRSSSARTLVVVYESYHPTKVELLQGAYTRQGKESGYLVGTREVLQDDRVTCTAGVRSVRTLLVVRTLKQSDQ